MNNRKFKLYPETFSTKVSVKEYDTSITTNYQCKMKQIPANINDATTGHKLQGMPKDVIIVASWPTKSMLKTGNMLSYPMYKHYQVCTCQTY
jgi:hypothetical protein